LAALSVGRKSSSSTPVARVLVVRRSTPLPIVEQPAKVEPTRLELVPANESRGGRLATEPLPLVRAPASERKPEPLPETRREEPEEIEPPKSARWPFAVVALVLVGASVFVGVRMLHPEAPPPLASAAPPPVVAKAPPPLPVEPPPASSESVSPIPSSPPPSGSTTTGTIRTTDPGHPIWIDGRSVGESPRAFIVPCGAHVVRVGNAGQPQMTEVPCGGEVALGFQ
jgi:hypothetical protein